MNRESNQLSCSISLMPPHFCQVNIHIPKSYVIRAYDVAAQSLTRNIDARGFSKGGVPLEYVKHNYKNHLLDHVKTFLFHYVVLTYLFKKLDEEKITILGEPRLIGSNIELGKPATFEFECTTVSEEFALRSWKHLPFKAPGRKHYRDIDRQVEGFIQEEQLTQKELSNENKVAIGDLICFTVTAVDKEHKPLFEHICETLWLKIGNEEGDTQFQKLFLDKKEGESYYVQQSALHEYFSDKLENFAILEIKIDRILRTQLFDFNALKEHFKIKTTKDMKRKLIEVFSFRNDVSQRRLMAEGALNLMIKHHPVQLPHHAILRKQQALLHILSMNPDYPVYKMERDFLYQVEQLALRQLRESTLVDKVAYDEQITANNTDIAHYLNLTKRPRTKEFIYFALPPTKLGGQEKPIPAEILKQHARREKTLNYIISQLTKQ